MALAEASEALVIAVSRAEIAASRAAWVLEIADVAVAASVDAVCADDAAASSLSDAFWALVAAAAAELFADARADWTLVSAVSARSRAAPAR